MNLTRNEFNALMCLKKTPRLTQREAAEKLDVSLGTVNKVMKGLTKRGLVEDGRVTAMGLSTLKPFRVENAVIMAAGPSSHFAPISYEKPKGLLRVRGEVLIERQIEQLRQAGITDIVVVVGYKKECFFYLEEKYGVQIVVNKEYATRNNNATLMAVREVLGNTYICSSDNYFTQNPFESHIWKSYYAAEYAQGSTKEWCIQANEKGRITNVTMGGSDAWYMIGHAYFDRGFSQCFVHILEAEYDDPRTADKLWEQLYLEHIDEFDMEIRRYPAGVIREFDSIDQLRDFDPLFLENLDSGIFDNIVAVLGCTKSEIHDIYPLKQGLTNLSCHFATNDGEYVYRHPGIGTEEMIDREAECQAQQMAKAMGIDDTFIFENPRKGWKISRFLPGCRQLDPHNPQQLKQAMEMARALHAQDIRVQRSFDYLAEGLKYESLLKKKGAIAISDYAEMAQNAKTLKGLADLDEARTCLTHNDFFNLNLLFDQCDRLYLIDWEYAGMSDYASDFGTFVVTCMLSEEEAETALEYYFGRTPTAKETRHNFAYVALAGWCWYVWALQKESEGDFVGDWLYTYYKYAKRYAAKALALYESK